MRRMSRRVQANALVVLSIGALLAVVPLVPAEVHELRGFEGFRERVLAGVGDDLSVVATHRIYHPTYVEDQVITVGEMLERARIVYALPEWGSQAETSNARFGYATGLGDPVVALAMGWIACWGAGQHTTFIGGPGQTFSALEPAAIPVPVLASEFCDGFFGPAYDWEDVTIDTRNKPFRVYDHCGGGQILVAMEGQTATSGLLGGGVCFVDTEPSTGVRVTSARGKGAAGSFSWPKDSMDFFLSSAAVVTIGDQSGG